MKRTVAVFLLVLMAAGLLTACQPQEQGSNPPEQGSGNEAGETGNSDKTLTVGMNAEPTSLNPHGANDVGTAYTSSLIFDTLVELTPDSKIVPSLATEWEQVDDTTIRFKLRDDACFANGDKCTAKDVHFTMEQVAASPFATGTLDMIDVENCVIEDDYTYVLKLKTPYAAIYNSLAHSLAGIVSSTQFDPEKPMGTGPFAFVKWEAGDYVELVPNEHYWGDPVSYSKLVLRYIPEDATRAIELETGGVDIAVRMSPNDAKRLMDGSNPDVTVEKLNILNTLYLSFNCQKEPFTDRRVRQAITHAIDIDSLVKASSEGLADRAFSVVSPDVIGYSDPGVIYDYDPEKAKELLAEAGYPDGFKTSISQNGNDTEAEMIQAYLAEVGIEAEIPAQDRAAWIDSLVTGKQEMYLGGWTASTGDADYAINGPFNSKNHGAGGNRSWYTNLELDPILEQAAVEMDPDKRMELYAQAQSMIAEDAVYVNLRVGYIFVGVRNNIKGLVMYPTQKYDFSKVTIE